MENKFNGAASGNRTQCTVWRRRTFLERYLILICVVIFIALIVTIGVIFHIKSARIISNIDFSVDPCKDFYDYSCGSFLKNHHIPGSLVTTLGLPYLYLEKVSKTALEAIDEKQQPEFVKKVQQYYKSCLSQWKDIEDIVEVVLQKTKLKIWPILEEEVLIDKVERSLAILTIFGNNNPLLYFYINSNRSEGLKAYAAGATVANKEILLNTTDETYIRRKENYKQLLEYTLYRLSLPSGSIRSSTEEVIKFETELAKIACTEQEENVTESTLKEMSSSCRKISWMKVIKYIYEYYGYSEEFSDEIPTSFNGCKEYMENLCELLEKNSYRTIYNYIVWYLLAQKLKSFNLQFENSLSEIRQVIAFPRWQICVSRMTYNMMSPGLSYIVIKYLQPEKTIEEVNDYVNEIKQTMDHTFSVENWLGSVGKSIARNKLKNLRAQIGYSLGSLELNLIEKHFAQVNITDSLLETDLLFAETETRLHLSSEEFNIDDHLNITFPVSESAFYEIDKDQIVITLGYLVPPYFAQGVPKYVNYAGVGTVIGHEFGHGFHEMDITNSTEYDTVSWPEETVEQFKERKQCYINQYSKFPLGSSGTMLNGTQTFHNDIADDVGLRQSFKAYENYVRANGQEPQLPGLADFTYEQIFFIKYAQTWCDIVDSEKMFIYFHSPARYRVIGPMQNFPRFSEVFNCPVDSPMNPRQKCQMYG